MKINKKLIIPWLSFLLISCSGDNDPGGKFWWTMIGFPLLGLAYFVGGFLMSLFQSKEHNKDRSPEPFPAIVIGIIALLIIYTIAKGMF